MEQLSSSVRLRPIVLAFVGLAFLSGIRADAATMMFSNSTSISIPGSGSGDANGAPASPYPSTINVSGITDTIVDVNVSLFNFSHTFPGDVDVLLVGPTGLVLLLMSDAGGGADAVNVNLTFDQSAASQIGATVVSGTFRPSNTGTPDHFPAPAPAGPYDNTSLDIFNGVNPNGLWSLFVVDDAAIDIGAFAGGWRLTLTTEDPTTVVPEPASLTLLGLGLASVVFRRRRAR